LKADFEYNKALLALLKSFSVEDLCSRNRDQNKCRNWLELHLSQAESELAEFAEIFQDQKKKPTRRQFQIIKNLSVQDIKV
jgi:hypothetical protein